jgi:hypothetical protein
MAEKPADGRWGSYPDTVLFFAGEPEIFVDLREPVPTATRGAFERIGLCGTFSIVTAYNPHGNVIPAEENDRRMAELESELRSPGGVLVRVDACSPDRSHCERSVALSGEMGPALDIAKKWEQIAIFWWDGSAFWIQGAITDGHLRLPV